MTSKRFFVLCFLIAVVCVFFVKKPVVYAQCTSQGTPVQSDNLGVFDIRPAGIPGAGTPGEFVVRISRPLGQGGAYTDYANGEDCGDASHRTRKGNRFFAHCRVNYTFPVTGKVIVNGVATNVDFTVTEENVKAYWDNLYGIGSSGGEGATCNCWAYSFGYSTWVQDPEWIYRDDYDELPNGAIDMLNNVSAEYVVEVGRNAHVATVEWTCGAENNVPLMETSEKNQYSGIYYFYWDAVPYSTAAGGPTGYHKRKP